MREKNVVLTNKVILVTGAAGFIGSNLVLELLREVPVHIIGIDNMNDYYDVSIKEYRLEQIERSAAEHPESSWEFIKGSIADKGFCSCIRVLSFCINIRNEATLPVYPFLQIISCIWGYVNP